MEKTQKKRLKRYLLWGGAAVLVAILALMPLLAKNGGTSDGPTASVITTTVETGTISYSLRGGGTIAVDGAEDVTIPSGVKITEFLVKNGDYVTEGTPVATVDKVSVMTAITELNDTLDYLREELEDARDEKVSAYVTATAGGRVKKVFAQAGDSVQDVMLRDGALAILSLDGKMAVKLEKNLSVTTGETVTVTLSDGKNVEGRVESNLDGVVVITIEDDGYEVGQSVTVTQNGATLGQSPLYIHNAWKATAYSGTIETVSAREERTLSSGATLFTLKDRDFEGELQHRANQHREYEELLQELLTMYETGVLTAPCDGEVSGVDKDSTHLLAATPDGWVLAPLDAVTTEKETGWTVMLLSNVTTKETTPGCTDNENCTITDPDAVHGENCIQNCTGLPDCPAKTHKTGCQSICTGAAGCLALQANHLPGCPEKCTNNANCISSRPESEHGSNCIVHCSNDTDGSDGCQCTAHTHYDTCVANCTGDKNCQAQNHQVGCYYYGLTYTAKVGVVFQCASGTIQFKYDASAQETPVTKGQNGTWVLTQQPDTTTMLDDGFVVSDVQCSQGDIILLITATNESGEKVMENQVYLYQTSTDSSDTSGTLGGQTGGMDISSMMGGFSGYGNYSGTYTAETEDLFDLDGEALLTVTPRNTVTLSISIDEHDISKVRLGQKATVRVAALKGQEYEAEVTAIAASGTNNGGSSKFSVELTFAMDGQLLSGMSASAVIPMESREGIRIPSAALQQNGAKIYVYTALDDDGQPTAPVEVETGLSDGEYVEVISGLEEGQQVCYCYYDTLELDTSAKADKYTFG